jgi:hypothetical protein
MAVFPPGAPGPREHFMWCVATPFYLKIARDFGPTAQWAYRRATHNGYFHHKDSCPGHRGVFCKKKLIAREVQTEAP